MTVTEPYDIVDISKKLHKNNSKANRKTLTAFVQCFTKGQEQNSHFLQCFKIQRKVTSLLLYLDCVSHKFFTQTIAPECNSLVTDLKNLISGLVWIPLEYQDVLHKTSQVLPN